MSTLYHILLVDDEADYADTLVSLADEYDMLLHFFEDWETAKSELINNFYHYHAVILDGKGKLAPNKKTDDSTHAQAAISDLEVLASQGRYIPFVINTGYHQDFSSFLSTEKYRIFDKSDDVKMLEALRELIAASDIAKLENQYPLVFKLAKRCFSKDKMQLLIDLLTAEHLGREETLTKLRILNEALCDLVPEYYYGAPYGVDDYLEKMKRNNIRVNSANRSSRILKYLSDVEGGEVPEPILRSTLHVYYTASQHMHKNIEDIAYYPSKEMVKGLLYCHLGCYHWFWESVVSRTEQ